MKTKIFALIIAVLCLSLLFVACSEEPCTEHKDENNDAVCDVCGEAVEQTTVETTEETTEAPVCETHKDDDANKICDACGIALVYVPELVAPEAESRVDMVVNPIPEDATVDAYVNVDYEEKVLSEVTALKGTSYTTIYRSNVDVRHVDKTDTESAAYVLYDMDTYEEIITIAVSDLVSVDFNDYYYAVETTSEDGKTVTYANYTYAGEPIGEAQTWNENNEDGQSQYEFYYENVYLYEDWRNSLIYFSNNASKVFVVDPTANKVIHTADTKTIVYRPYFTVTTETVGYVYDQQYGTVYAYDLTKWIECIMSFEIPGYYNAVKLFPLADGNLIIQASVQLADDAVSYDVISGGDKYDIVYVLADVEAKTQTVVEFGYYISHIDHISVGAGEDEKAYNMITVNPIKDSRVSQNNTMYLIVDNDLTIKCDLTDFHKQESVLIADGLFRAKVKYNNTSVELAVIKDVYGNVVAEIPVLADIYNTYIYFDEGIYDLKMNLLVDLTEENGYRLDYQTRNYVMLYKDVETENGWVTEHYFFNPAKNEAPVKLNYENIYFSNTYDDSFVIRYTVTVDGTPTTMYELFNSENTSLFKDDAYFNAVEGYGSTLIYTSDNLTYVVK